MKDFTYRPAGDLGLPHAKRIASLRREGGLAESVVHILWWQLVRGYLGAFHRFDVRGRERLPTTPPFVMVANHSSHLDALSLMAALRWPLRERVHPIAAGDTFFESVATGTFAAFAINALPLWRKDCDPADVQELRRRLVEEPCGYVLFPEGTRTRTGEMARFKRGIGMLVAGTAVPVIACRLTGAFEAFPAARRWPKPGRVRLTVGGPLTFSDAPDTPEGWTRVAAESEAAVRRLE